METKKFGVHKIWFFYTDEWYVTDNNLATCVDTYDTLEEAEEAKKKLDIQSLKDMNSEDYVRDLMGFMEEQKQDPAQQSTVEHLIEYARSIGWEEFIKVNEYTFTGQDGKEVTHTYYELGIPNDATDEQLWEIIQITQAYFHRIVTYQDVKKCTYVQFNPNFWEEKVLDIMEQQSLVGPKTTMQEYFWYHPEEENLKYLMYNAEDGTSSARHMDPNEAQNAAMKVVIHYLNMFPESFLLGKSSITELSESVVLLKNYLQNCQTIGLDTLGKKLKFSKTQSIDLGEFKGLLELLKVKPFEVEEVVVEINGEEVQEVMVDYGTL
ncbi:MAG TPA: hypothetical protein DCS93_21865 [Microscillaceae bacterium]|nr:hypothetical protein [Microscillaceae bacterium]